MIELQSFDRRYDCFVNLFDPFVFTTSQKVARMISSIYLGTIKCVYDFGVRKPKFTEFTFVNIA